MINTAPRRIRSTLTTLKFASRARDITTHAMPNDEETLGRDERALMAKVVELKVGPCHLGAWPTCGGMAVSIPASPVPATHHALRLRVLA